VVWYLVKHRDPFTFYLYMCANRKRIEHGESVERSKANQVFF